MFNTIYISNLSEDVWPFINAISRSDKRIYEIEENAKLSDRDIFSFCDQKNVIIILPFPIDQKFFHYFTQVTGNNTIFVLSPKKHTGETCRDIIHDSRLFNYLVKQIKKAKKMNIVPYSSSPQFYFLLGELKLPGLKVNSQESPGLDNSWIVDFCGSKSGIRQLALQSQTSKPDLKMPYGLISFGLEDAAKIAAKLYRDNKGIVIKTNKGHSGAGVLIFRSGDLPRIYSDCVKTIYNQLKKNDYWSKFPIIIERFIEPNNTIGGGFPNAEYRITRRGKIEFLYFCSMRVNSKGEFKGIETHKNVLPHKVAATMIDLGFFIGEKMRNLGYVGYYEVDMIASKDGQLFLSESNVRRTGGTHVYHLARHLFGNDFMNKTYTLSNNLHPIHRRNIGNFNDLYSCLSPILYKKTTKEGLVIISVALLPQNKFGYVIFGNNKKRAYAIEKQMDGLLAH